MSRKTHPISHRLGITMWWPSRTPIASRVSPTRKGNSPVIGRGSKITELLKGILMKYGYRVATPNITTTATSKGKAGRIVLVVRKGTEIKGRRDKSQWASPQKKVNMPIRGRERAQYWKKAVKEATTIPTYIMSYVRALIGEYEKKDYRIELREQQEEYTQITAEQIAQKITRSEKSVIPTMVEIQRRVTKSQAYIEQQQAYISKKDRV